MVSPARKALRRMWKDTCTVYEYQPVLQSNMSTVHEEVAVISDEPCKLSFASLQSANQTDTAAKTPQTVKLFLDETLEIKAGCKIVVKRRDQVFEYGYSGEAGVFEHHREIVLIPFEGWAV
ncbi:MAG: hypothetical protein FWC70_08110 [Defluviitaleaceae bacterium]|nr:hypothetical protein [Defluviitaleaceae bacterium]